MSPHPFELEAGEEFDALLAMEVLQYSLVLDRQRELRYRWPGDPTFAVKLGPCSRAEGWDAIIFTELRIRGFSWEPWCRYREASGWEAGYFRAGTDEPFRFRLPDGSEALCATATSRPLAVARASLALVRQVTGQESPSDWRERLPRYRGRSAERRRAK